MMRSSIIALATLITISPLAAHADATDFLFAAIEAQNVELVEKAMRDGAQVNIQRPSDGLDAKTLAYNQVKRFFESVGSLFLAPMASSLGLLMASSLYNKYYTLAALAGFTVAGYLSLNDTMREASSQQNASLEQQTSMTEKVSSIIRYLSTGGLLASAWASNELILSSIGTAGLAFTIYQFKKFETANKIYALVDPELSLYQGNCN